MVWLHLLIFQEKMLSLLRERPHKTVEPGIIISKTLRYQIRVRVTDPSGGMSQRKIRLGASITLSPLPGVPTQLSTHQKP